MTRWSLCRTGSRKAKAAFHRTPSNDVDGHRADARRGVQIVQVVGEREAGLHPGTDEGLLGDGELIHPVAADAEALMCPVEQGLDCGCLPARIALARPVVVVLPRSERGGAAIVRRAAADHSRAGQVEHAARGAGCCQAPVVGQRDRLRVENLLRPLACRKAAIIGTRLKDQHRFCAVRGQSGCGGRPASAGPDHNGAGFGGQFRMRHHDPSSSAHGLRRSCGALGDMQGRAARG